MLQIPNAKTLPYWLIGMLVAAIGVLFARIEKLQGENDGLNRDWAIKLDGCQNQKNEYLLRQIEYNHKQDSITKAHEYELEKLKNK